MIPETQQLAVERALQAAFGINECEDIQPLTGGLSTALVYKITVKNNPYLLKVLRKEMISNPANEFACMQTAADAGLAPRIWYANVQDRILITDFVQARPLPDNMLPLIVPILRTLHTLPGFPKMTYFPSYFDAIDAFILRFKAANILQESETAELFHRYAAVQSVYPRSDAELVASHNDLKPQNMRFDGSQIWLVDWESAFLNDPYVDLVIVANFFVPDEAEEEAYLTAYFGQPATAYQRARFYLARQAVSMFYATLLLLEAARSGLPIPADLPTPDFREYHQGLIADKINMLNAEPKLPYGILHLRHALHSMRAPRFAESVATVGNFHAEA